MWIVQDRVPENAYVVLCHCVGIETPSNQEKLTPKKLKPKTSQTKTRTPSTLKPTPSTRAQDRVVEKADEVLWHCFGVAHIPRPEEDFQDFHLKAKARIWP